MKINFKSNPRLAYAALFIVLSIALISLLLLAGSMNSLKGTENLNKRATELMSAQNAAEAAVEKVIAQLQYDFQVNGGSGRVVSQTSGGVYAGMYPGSIGTDDPYWANFQFSDAQGHNNKTYIQTNGFYSGPVYPLTYTVGNTGYTNATQQAAIYRIVSNAKAVNGYSGVIGTAQEDILLATVPLTAYAIFYNNLLEFSTCATMTVNGPVHSNNNIDVGAGSGATLTFNQLVSASGTVSAPTNNGSSWNSPNSYNTGWRTTFEGSSNFVNGAATIQTALPMTNTISLIQIPATNNATTLAGQQLLYNQAQVVLLVSNLPSSTNTVVYLRVQKSPDSTDVPGADGSPSSITYTNPTPGFLTTNMPFLSLTNRFYDGREGSTNITTQIDIGQYNKWLTNNSLVTGKFPASGSSGYPTILYVSDTRTTNTVNKLAVVRLTNGIAPPANGGEGFSLATPNPLYVWGNYNETNASNLGTTNTSSGTVPAALFSDALTILSPAWTDANSLHNAYSTSSTAWNATNTTVNAAIVTGIVPSTGITTTTFSGGVHNLTRLLEDWSGETLTINTSIINLFNSANATTQFQQPGTYYDPPTRQFSYDLNFNNPAKVPPGIPCALVAMRWDWCNPPAGSVTYNVVP